MYVCVVVKRAHMYALQPHFGLWSHCALRCPQTVPAWPMILMATFTAQQASPHVTPGNSSVLKHDAQVV